MILYLIPARGGSKRLPGKNLRKLAGIPLVAWAIRRAQQAARLVGGEYRIVVSTDSEEIAGVALEWGAEVLTRPAYLAADDASSEAVAWHAFAVLSGSEPDLIALVQPTSPLSRPCDLSEVVRSAALYASVAVTKDGKPTGGGYVLSPQDLIAGRHFWDGHMTFQVTDSNAFPVDIDTEDDWHMAEALLAARPVAPFNIAGRDIGPGHPCFVIAEAGINHGGNPERAFDLVAAAAEAGADAVKFQSFQPDLLAEPGAHRDMLSGLTLPKWAYAGLKNLAKERGLMFLSSVFDAESADFVDEYVPAHKIPSGEIINLPLLRYVASKGKPVILSTGMSTMREIAAALDALEGVPVALLHCVSEYPTLPDDVNLRAMATMRQAFGLPVGWSDHLGDCAVAEAAGVALGASIIEKHIAIGRDSIDRDVSVGRQRFRQMVEGIRELEAALGSGEKVPTAGELETAKVARRRDGLRRNAS